MGDNEYDINLKELEEILKECGPGGYHAVPEENDIADHVEATNCWCQPKMIYRNAEERKEVWVHRLAKSNPH